MRLRDIWYGLGGPDTEWRHWPKGESESPDRRSEWLRLTAKRDFPRPLVGLGEVDADN